MPGNTYEATIATPTDREIVITRVFDAARDLIFEAHTSCERMRNWWGPAQYGFASCEMDFRPGGSWRIVQRGPDGAEFSFRGEFREIERPERIVWTFEFEGMPGNVAVETLTLTEEDGKTKLTATAIYDSREDRDAMLADGGMEEGVRETYQRLEQYVKTLG